MGLGQPFVMEPKKSVGDILKEQKTTLSRFIRLEVGEGIEVAEGPSFADEVAAMAKGSDAPPAKAEEPKAEEPKVEEPKAEEAKPAAAVTVSLIKELRTLTGAGMMDCKK